MKDRIVLLATAGALLTTAWAIGTGGIHNPAVLSSGFYVWTFGIAGLAVLLAVWLNGRIMFPVGLMATGVVTIRAVGLLLDTGVSAPAVVWLYAAFLQTLVWGHVLEGRAHG